VPFVPTAGQRPFQTWREFALIAGAMRSRTGCAYSPSFPDERLGSRQIFASGISDKLQAFGVVDAVVFLLLAERWLQLKREGKG
jgi:hypothetical protein